MAIVGLPIEYIQKHCYAIHPDVRHTPTIKTEAITGKQSD